jgi:glutathione S-transferase
MGDELVFYTNPMSRGQIVRWMLEETGEPYRTEVLSYDSVKTPAYLAINPMGKVPAIVHRGHVVTECAAICAYLADAFPQAGLAPPSGSPDRAAYYRWLFFAAGPFEAANTNKAAKFESPANMSRSLGYGDYDAPVNTLQAAVEATLDHGGFLAGARFSAADLYVGAQLGFAMRFGMVEKRPAFVTYVEGLQQRPAYQRAQQIDNALIAEMQKA